MANPVYSSPIDLQLSVQLATSAQQSPETYEDLWQLSNAIRRLMNYIRSVEGGLAWGSIAGTITNQADLMDMLDDFIADAPVDGKVYGRKDAAWEEITGGGGTPTPTTPVVPAVTGYNNNAFTSALTSTSTVPWGAAVGDTLFLYVMARSAVTTPAGWTLVASVDVPHATAQSLKVFSKVAVAADIKASVVVTQATSSRISTHIISVANVTSVVATTSTAPTGTYDKAITAPMVAPAGSLMMTGACWITAATSGTNYGELMAPWFQTSLFSSTSTSEQVRMAVGIKQSVGETSSGMVRIRLFDTFGAYASISLVIT